jgi:hypothetical protein
MMAMLNNDTFKALCIALLIAIMVSCKQENVVTEDKLQRVIDSIAISNKIWMNQFEKLIKENKRIDTVIIINHKTTNNAVKKIDHLNNSQLNNALDSVLRAEGFGGLPNK